MADPTQDKVGSALVDATALQDIATNGALLNQATSRLIETLQRMGDIVLPIARGGTGRTSYGVGDLIYADTATSLTGLPDVAVGKVLLSNGVGVPPVWGDISLSTLSGTVPVTNGGTGRTTLTAHNLLIGDGTNNVGLIAPGTDGLPLVSQGASANPAYQQLTTKWMYAALSLFPDNGDQTIVINSYLALKILGVTTQSTTGTATLTVKINSTALGGTANSVSTSEQTQTHSTNNDVAVGDNIVLTWSSVTDAENVSILIYGTMAVPQ